MSGAVSTAPLLFAATAMLALMVSSAPGLGVSFAAPCFGLLAVERLLARERRPLGPTGAFAGMFVAACALSLAAPLWSGRAASVAGADVLLLARTAYWAAVLALTADALARAEWTPRLALWAAGLAVALAALRLTDGWMQGGLQRPPRWLSQNDYGLRFSLFTPFLVGAALVWRRARSAAWLAALAVVLTVALLNGSRSAWAAALLGGAAVAAIHWFAGRLRLAPTIALTAALAAGAALPWTLSDPVRRGFEARLSTLSRLETDKSVRTRRLLVEKGLLLFERQPLLGHGLGSFSKSEVRLATLDAAWLTDDDLNARSAHNSYIKVLAETGLAGSLPLLGLLGWLAARGLPAAVRLTRQGQAWAAAAYGSFVAVSAHLWTLSGLTGTEPWFIYGWVAAAILRDRDQPRA